MRARPTSVIAAAMLVASGLAAATARAEEPSGRPANDDYADATVIAELPFTETLDLWEATDEVTETSSSCPSSIPSKATIAFDTVTDQRLHTVWYRFEPEADTTITIDPRDSDTRLIIGVWQGTDLATQTEVGCMEYAGSERLVLDLDGGQSYAIQVAMLYEAGPSVATFEILEGDVVTPRTPPAFRVDGSTDPGPGDATVVAVIDTTLSPYHWDFLASRMPQAIDGNPHNDLPLDRPPHEWLPGFPDPETAFASYRSIGLTLEEHDPDATYQDLRTADVDEWDRVQPSSPDAIAYQWFPGTKVIGGLTFRADGRIEPGDGFDHGHRVASSGVGNYEGTCPECLLVFIQVDDTSDGETENRGLRAAREWAQAQPWIDVINSSFFGAHEIAGSPEHAVIESNYPDWFEHRLDVDVSRAAAERGQTLFQAAGNGVDYQYAVPNPTSTSSHAGPDWLVTVGATHPRGGRYLGTGIPADIAAPGQARSASTAETTIGGRRLNNEGTSFSSPAVAGTYAHALHHVRRALPGASRIQTGGVIATTDSPVPCAATRPACELGDGVLTATELRTRLLEGATPSTGAPTHPSKLVAADDAFPVPEPVAEEWRMLGEGHGIYSGRMLTDAELLAEIDRILDPMFGLAPVAERPDGERDWMTVDSWCRQEIWGPWGGGYYVDGETALPGPSADWPIRSAVETTCPHLPLPLDTGLPIGD